MSDDSTSTPHDATSVPGASTNRWIERPATVYDPTKHLPCYDRDGTILGLAPVDDPEEWEELKGSDGISTYCYVKKQTDAPAPKDAS
jgi:hypothetical protein